MVTVRMKLPQLLLHALCWLVLVAGSTLSSWADDADKRVWFDILSDAKTIMVVAAQPKENEGMKGKTYEGKAVTRLVTLAAKASRVKRLDGEVRTGIHPVIVQIEILTFDKRRIHVFFHVGGATFIYNEKTFVADFEKLEEGMEFLAALGAKWPEEERD